MKILEKVWKPVFIVFALWNIIAAGLVCAGVYYPGTFELVINHVVLFLCCIIFASFKVTVNKP